MTKSFSTALLVALAGLPLAAAADPTNLVVNGSFEANALPLGSFQVFSNPQVPGWTLARQLELRHGVAGTAEDGLNFAELDAFANNAMSQVLGTVAGSVYELSFWYSNRVNVPVASNGMSFDLGAGAVVLPALALNNTGNNVWTHVTSLFTASAAQTTLTFAALGTSDSFGTSLDDVRVVGAVPAVPEPETYALLLAGLGSIGLVARRRSQRR